MLYSDNPTLHTCPGSTFPFFGSTAQSPGKELRTFWRLPTTWSLDLQTSALHVLATANFYGMYGIVKNVYIYIYVYWFNQLLFGMTKTYH